MLDQIRRLLGSFDPARSPRRGIDDPRVAAAALLVHVAEADGAFSEEECGRLRTLLREKFAIGEREAAALVAEGRRADAEAIDLYGFTSVLMSRMDEGERLRFVDLLWSLIYADGEIHELEDNLAWRICELLGVSTEERMAAKRRAAQSMTALGTA